MSTLMEASRQWSTRPADERFVSIPLMLEHYQHERDCSRGVVVGTDKIEVQPVLLPDGRQDHKGLAVVGPAGTPFAPTNWSFRQLCGLATGGDGAATPSSFLAGLPSPIAADVLNYKLKFRDVQDVGLLLRKPNGEAGELRAATGPRYGRVWQADVLQTLQNKLDLTAWRVPGEFGKRVTVTKDNTTLYGSDRDMFVFLADEDHRVDVPARRDGQHGSLARGFFLRNSETGASTLALAAFYFDYVCQNRIVWGVEGFTEVSIRHTAGAPDRWLDELQPALLTYANRGTATIEEAIAAAKTKKIEQDLNEFLAKRFAIGPRVAQQIANVHQLEEGRPIETLWDAATGVTAYARSIEWQDNRVELERIGGKILDLAAA
jgi:Domain of unknown function (DUF932)